MLAIAGAIYNRLRGTISKELNAIAYGAIAIVFTGSFIQGIACGIGMFIGQKPGWGDYIGALGGWRTQALSENRYIDKIIKPWVGEPKLWGFFGLLFRGAFWGFCLALPSLSPALYWAGLSMPLVYLFALKLSDFLTDIPNSGWVWGEYAMGAMLWGVSGLVWNSSL